MRSKRWLVLVFLAVSLLVPGNPARADAAPPVDPPGGDISPEGATEVEMVAEKVVIDLRQTDDGTASVTAWFLLQNTGTVDEHLKVRFPLNGDPLWNPTTEEYSYPLITDFKVWNGSQQLSTQKIEDNNLNAVEYFLGYGSIIYWSVFEADFPVDEQVELTVRYSLDLTELNPSSFVEIFYILATGAGWKGPIRDAEIVLRFPFIINELNVPSLGSVFFGAEETVVENELCLHLVDFEPRSAQNLQAEIVKPSLWQDVLAKRLQVISMPDDSSAWVNLASAYAAAGLDKHGWFSDEQSALAFTHAFLKAVELDPENLHYHLELLRTLDYSYGYGPIPNYIQTVMLNEAAAILQLDPANQEVLDMVASWRQVSPDLILPTPVPPFSLLVPTPTSSVAPTQAKSPTFTPIPRSYPSATQTIRPTATPVPLSKTSTPQPETLSGIVKNIGIGLAGLLLGFIAGGVSFWLFSSFIRNRRTQG